MKSSKVVKNLIYLLIMSTFFFDSYFKLTNLPKEADLLRSKYSNLQDFLNRTLQTTLPLSLTTITEYAPYIITGFAILQGLIAFLVVLGSR
jgi:hypothetical protein